MKVTDDDYAWPIFVDGKWYHHVTGFLESMKHRENPQFAEAIRKERSPSIAREMGDDAKVLWADLELGKRKLAGDEAARFEREKNTLRARALAVKFESSLWRSLSSDDPEAVDILNIINSDVNRTTSRSQSRDPSRTAHHGRQSHAPPRGRWDRLRIPGD